MWKCMYFDLFQDQKRKYIFSAHESRNIAALNISSRWASWAWKTCEMGLPWGSEFKKYVKCVIGPEKSSDRFGSGP